MAQEEIVAWMRANPGPCTAFDIADGAGLTVKVAMTGLTRLRKWGDVTIVGVRRREGCAGGGASVYILTEERR